MKYETAYFINVFSTLSAAIPIGVGMLVSGQRVAFVKYFLLFLSIGFLVDLLGWYNAHFPNNDLYSLIRKAYWLIDLTFYAWFLRSVTKSKVMRNTIKWVFFGLALLWVAHLFVNSVMNHLKLFLGISYAFAAGYIVLELIENKQQEGLPILFWLVFGIFFYHFCTFFIMGMITTSTGNSIWWMHNAINITTNVIYAVGFWVCRDEFAAGKVESQSFSKT
jgi:hypothetical protein